MKLTIISKIIPNFGNQILPNFAKVQNLEFFAFRSALVKINGFGRSQAAAVKLFYYIV